MVDKVAKKSGSVPFLLLVFVYFISMLGYFAGGYSANKQEYFFTTDKKPNYILIREYGDYWLALKVDAKSRLFQKTYELIAQDEIDSFSRTKVGKLRPVPERVLKN